MRIVANRLIEVSQLKLFVRTIRQLSHNATRLASHYRKARNDHVGRDNRAVQDLDVVLDNGKLVDDAAIPDVHVIPDARRLHHGVLPDEDVVSDSQRHVREDALVDAPGRPQQHGPREEAIAADGDGGGVLGSGSARRGRWRGGADEVASDHDFGLDDGLSTEHDILGADEDGLAGDLVAGVLMMMPR